MAEWTGPYFDPYVTWDCLASRLILFYFLTLKWQQPCSLWSQGSEPLWFRWGVFPQSLTNLEVELWKVTGWIMGASYSPVDESMGEFIVECELRACRVGPCVTFLGLCFNPCLLPTVMWSAFLCIRLFQCAVSALDPTGDCICKPKPTSPPSAMGVGLCVPVTKKVIRYALSEMNWLT